MFSLNWTEEAIHTFEKLEKAAESALKNRKVKGKKKGSKQEGLFKQVVKTLKLLRDNPRHPGLATHQYYSLDHPWSNEEKIFEAYVQNRTPGAYRVFWCYGPKQKMITIIALTPHP